MNQQPLGYEPNEIPFLYSASNKILAGEAGLEPAECRSQNPVPYQLGYSPILVSAEGFEPSFSSSQARRINLPFLRRDIFTLGRATFPASHNIVCDSCHFYPLMLFTFCLSFVLIRILVPPAGLEPAWISPLDPKSSVSANSTIGAYLFGRTDGTRTRNILIDSQAL